MVSVRSCTRSPRPDSGCPGGWRWRGRGGEDEAEEEAQREAANANTKQDQSCETDTQCDTNCLKTSPTLNLIWGFVDVTLGRL